MEPVLILILGIIVGGASGLLGIGGGVLLIPGLMYLFGYSQTKAQGTTLAAMIPPIGLGAAYQYYRQGEVDVLAAILIALGFTVGAFITASYIKSIPIGTLRFLFGMLLLYLGMRFILASHRPAMVYAGAIAAWLSAWALFVLFKRGGAAHGVRPTFRSAVERSAKASPPDGDYQI